MLLEVMGDFWLVIIVILFVSKICDNFLVTQPRLEGVEDCRFKSRKPASILVLENLVVNGNRAGESGGAVDIRSVNENVLFQSSEMNGNTAGRDGGAISVSEEKSVEFDNVVCRNNSALQGGGGCVFTSLPMRGSISTSDEGNGHSMAQGGQLHQLHCVTICPEPQQIPDRCALSTFAYLMDMDKQSKMFDGNRFIEASLKT